MAENFGSYLKHERELRGVPLEEIAEVTKVHIRFLEALENNEFDQLPGEVFIKGYIRSYAKAIGLDSEEMVNAYDDGVGKDRRLELENARLASEKIHSRNKNLMGFVIGGIGLTAVLVMGYWGVVSLVDKNNEEGAEQSSLSDPAPNGVEPETLLPSDLAGEEGAENGGISGQELEKAVSKEAPSSSRSDKKSKPKAPVETARTEVKKTKPVAVETKLKKKPSSPQEAKKNKPKTPSQTSPESPQPKVEKTKPVAVEAKLKEKPSSPQEAKKTKPETPEKPSETQKDPDPSEKPVIIQHVEGEPEEAELSSDEVATNPKRLHLMIQVQGNSWFNVVVDDGGEDDFILPGGTSKNIYGSEKFRVTIGNRRGTRIFLNGKSIDLPFGTSDVIRDFDITAKLIE
jgi:cytoskeleton protein RodZ